MNEQTYRKEIDSRRSRELHQERKVQTEAQRRFEIAKAKLEECPKLLTHQLLEAKSRKITKRKWTQVFTKDSEKTQLKKKNKDCKLLKHDLQVVYKKKAYDLDKKLREAGENIRTIDHLLGMTQYVELGVPKQA